MTKGVFCLIFLSTYYVFLLQLLISMYPCHFLICICFLKLYWYWRQRAACHYELLQELSQLCAIIVEPLRDRIVTSLLQATLVYSLPFASFHKSVKFTVIFISLEFYFIIYFFYPGWFTPCCIRWRPITNFLFGRCKAIRRRFGGPQGTCFVPFEYCKW